MSYYILLLYLSHFLLFSYHWIHNKRDDHKPSLLNFLYFPISSIYFIPSHEYVSSILTPSSSRLISA